jgi:methylamine---glutamate N-methyltransferase subunit A
LVGSGLRWAGMCGIAGIYSKSPDTAECLGELMSLMVAELGERGPDSAGIALYRAPAVPGQVKVTAVAKDPGVDWQALGVRLAERFGGDGVPIIRASHATFTVTEAASGLADWFAQQETTVAVTSVGRSIEIYKEAGTPLEFIRHLALSELSASHAVAHTRMATESRVTTEHSHPFSTGLDLCLVHNGSLSNHNVLRRRLERHGVRFQTDNDSEVAAGYLTWRMREGATLEQALSDCLDDLDGFYTFAVGTADGFAVLRDPIACKPAVIAETDEWIAMASEYRAIAVLPGSEDAKVWEPEPGRIYSWERGTTREAIAA